jgi:hypothetical protein
MTISLHRLYDFYNNKSVFRHIGKVNRIFLTAQKCAKADRPLKKTGLLAVTVVAAAIASWIGFGVEMSSSLNSVPSNEASMGRSFSASRVFMAELKQYQARGLRIDISSHSSPSLPSVKMPL